MAVKVNVLFMIGCYPYPFGLKVQTLLIETPILGFFQKVRAGVQIIVNAAQEIPRPIGHSAPYDCILRDLQFVTIEDTHFHHLISPFRKQAFTVL